MRLPGHVTLGRGIEDIAHKEFPLSVSQGEKRRSVGFRNITHRSPEYDPFCNPALADPIEGNWRTASGETAAIGKCGSAYCIVLKPRKHAGRRIGRVTGSSGSFKGKLTDPVGDKTVSGSARIKGASMSLTGCALAVFCKTQKWARK